MRINNDAYQVRYIGPDGKRYSKSFSQLEDAKYCHAAERRMIDQGEWTPPATYKRTITDLHHATVTSASHPNLT